MILANSLATPALGLIVWTTLIFIIFFVILAKFAWPQILNAVNARNERIRSSLQAAEKAREDMLRLQADNEMILRQAREEKDHIIREARIAAEKIVSDSKDKAVTEANALIGKAKKAIEREKEAAKIEIRQQVALLSLEVASRVVEEKLKASGEQEKLIEKYLSGLGGGKN